MSARVTPTEVAASREYFYVGGEYAKTPSGHVFQNQMYVERLVPSGGNMQTYPLIFLHGGAQTGTNWLNKPDGNAGWASYFLNEGYEVYIIDQTTRGRSAWLWSSKDTGVITITAEQIEKRFTATKIHNKFPHSQLHTQWPGTGRMGDPFFDAYFSSLVQFAPNTSDSESNMRNAGIALLDKIGPAILVGHSQGAIYAWLWADARPELVKAIIAIEPSGPPFQDSIVTPTAKKPYGLTSLPLKLSGTPTAESGGDNNVPIQTQVTKIEVSGPHEQTEAVLQAEPARQFVNLTNIPVLVETGDASYHTAYDHCTVAFLRQAGVDAEHMKLGKLGIHGNGHMQFLEKNSDDIAAVLKAWLSKTVISIEARMSRSS